MQSRTALVLAIVTGTLAVGLVAADLAWTLTVRVDARTDAGWQTVARSDDRSGYEYEPRPLAGGCLVAGRDARIFVDNDKPLPDTVEILVSFYNQSSDRQEALFEATWSLGAFDAREASFKVPAAALPPDDENADRPPYGKTGMIEVRYDDRFLSACVEEGS